MTVEEVMFADPDVRNRLLEELEALEQDLMERSVSAEPGFRSEGFVLARVIPGMSEDEWKEMKQASLIDSTWIGMSLGGDKEALLLSLQQRMESLSRASNRDYLTGLYNVRFFRRLLTREMERAVRYMMPITLVILDIDDFKSINDNFGHGYGDGVLRELAVFLDAQIRASDFVARIGGEEFAIILPGTGQAMAEPVLKRIQEDLKKSGIGARQENGYSAVKLSMGAATYMGTESMTPKEFMARADRELYAVKRSGKNAYRNVLIEDVHRDKTMVRPDEKDFLTR